MRTTHMNNVKYHLIVVLLFLTQLIQAQTEFADNVEDVPAAPIDEWALPMLIIGIMVMLFYCRKQQQVTK